MGGFLTPQSQFLTPDTNRFLLPASVTDPLFGSYPSEQRAGQTGAINPVSRPVSLFGGAVSSATLSAVNGTLGTDITPQEQSARDAATAENAIARIMAVNPDLGKELLAQMGGQAHSQGSLFDSLKHLAGDILTAPIKLGAQALEIISRPAHIIPALLDHKSGEPWWETVGHVLSGSDATSWSKVLEDKFGMHPGFLTGALGFLGDVATDPLSYVTFGTIGIGREVAARVGAEAVVGHVAREIGARVAGTDLAGGAFRAMTGEEAGNALLKMYQDLTHVGQFRPGGFGTLGDAGRWEIDPDVAASISGMGVKATQQQAIASVLEAADRVSRLIAGPGLSKSPEVLAQVLGRAEPLTKVETLKVLEQGRRAQLMLANSLRGGDARAAYKAAKGFAAGAEGIRFRFAIPFVDLRYISNPLPFTAGSSPYGPVRRFFTGQSASTRLLQMVDKGNADWRDYFTWVDGGYKALREHNLELHDLVRSRGLGFGGMYDSLSEQFGGITNSLTPSARALRSGIAGHMATNVRRLALTWRDDFLQYAWDWKGADASLTRRQVEDLWGKAWRGAFDGTDPTLNDRAIQYKELVPHREHDADLGAYFDSRQRMLGPDDGTEEWAAQAAEIDAARREAVQLQGTLTAEQRHAIYVEDELQHPINELLDRSGAPMGDTTIEADAASSLHPADVPLWNGNSRIDLRDVTFYRAADQPGQARLLERKGTDVTMMGHGGDEQLGWGMKVTSEPAEGAVPVAVRLHRPAVIDLRAAGDRPGEIMLDDSAKVADLYKKMGDSVEALQAQNLATAATIRKATEGIEALAGKVDFKALEADASNRVHQLVTAALQKDGHDGVLIIKEDGTKHLMVFRTKDVKPVSEAASFLVSRRGYIPRVLSEKMSSFLRGNMPEEEANRIIYGEPKLHHDIRRVDPKLTFHESEQRARDLIAERMALTEEQKAQLATIDVFERDMLKRHNAYATRSMTRLLHEELGWNAGRIAYMADTAQGLLGGPVGRTVWDAQKAADIPEANLGQLPKAVQKTLNRVVASHGRLLLALEREATAAERAMVRVRAAVQGEGMTRAAISSRQSRFATRQTAGEAARELLALGQQRKRLAKVVNDVTPFVDRQSGDGIDKVGPILKADARGSSREVKPEEYARLRKQGAAYLDGLATRTSPTFWQEVKASPKGPAVTETGTQRWDKVVQETYQKVQDPWGGATIDAHTGEFLPDGQDLYAGRARSTHPSVTMTVADAQDPKKFARTMMRARNTFARDLKREGHYLGVFHDADSGLVEFDPSVVVGSKRLAEGVLLETRGVGGAYHFKTGDGLFPPHMAVDPRAELDAVDSRINDLRSTMAAGASPRALVPAPRDYGKLTPFTEMVPVAVLKKYAEFGRGHVERLAADIKENGIREPLRLVYNPNNGHVLLREGNHRLAAAELAGLTEVPVHVVRSNYLDKGVVLPGHPGLDAAGNFPENFKPSDIGLQARDLSAPATPAEAKTVGGKAFKEVDAIDHMANSLQDEYTGLTAEEVHRARTVATMERRLNDAIGEVNKAIANSRTPFDAPSEALVPKDRSRYGFIPVQVMTEDGTQMAMPAYIAAEFNSVTQGGRNIGYLHREWRRFLGVWKEWATFRYPGFHIRNLMGAVFNNMLGGVDIQDYRVAIRIQKALNRAEGFQDAVVPADVFRRYRLDRRFGSKANGVLTYGDLANSIHDTGIGTANAMAVAGVRSLPEAIEREVGAAGYRGWLTKARQQKDVLDELSPFIPFTRKFGRSATAHTENFVRSAAFMGGLKQTRGDFLGARAFTMMRHGDYNDLTDFERNFVKDVIPFYKWLRTNFPYQLRTLMENPAVSLTVQKAQDLPYTLQGINPLKARSEMPVWMRQNLNIPLKHGDATTYLMLDMPFNDLQKSARDMLSSSLPLALPSFEAFIGKDLFTGGDVLPGHYVPMAGWATLPGIKQVLEATGMVKQGADGGLLIDQRAQKVLGTVPIFSRFNNWIYADPARANLRLSTILSNMTGVAARPIDPSIQVGRDELAFYYDQVEPVIRQYKDLGIPLPTLEELGQVTSAYHKNVGLFG